MIVVDDILLSPLKGLMWLAKKINEVAEAEFSDEGRIKENLMQLQLRFEMDEIDEQEYYRQEKEILDRLNTIRKAEE